MSKAVAEARRKALQWLRDNGVAVVWLTTGPETDAAGFYEHRGWIPAGVAERGQTRYEFRFSESRPA